MRVAVLISTYNGEKYIEEQIDSIFNQETGHTIDVYVRDDGSTDGTVAVLERIKTRKTIHILTDGENLRPARSFIKLLQTVDGYDCYAFADQDDYWYKDKIERALNHLQGHDEPALYHSNSRLVDQERRPLGANLYVHNAPPGDVYSIFCACNVQGCTMVINSLLASFITSHEIPQKLIMHDAYIAKVCAAVGGSIIYDHQPSMDYRQHSNNVLGAKTGIIEKAKQKAAEIFQQSNISIADQARDIIKEYGDLIPSENKAWILKVSDYKKNILTRVSLSLSAKPKFVSKNRAVTTRAGILLGNR